MTDVAPIRLTQGVFSRFAVAVSAANVGDGIAVIAWAWTASLLTRDPFLIALLPAALRVPWVIFALPSGVLADRVDRKRLIVACDLVRAAAYGLAGVAILLALPLAAPLPTGLAQPALYATLLGLGVLIGCAEVARDNAAQSMLPSLVPSRELERANGWLESIETVANRLIGPAMGSFLIALFLPLPFLVIAAAFLIGAVLTAGLTGQFKAQRTRSAAWYTELADGFRFVVAHPTLRTLAWITGIWNFFAEMALIALVLHIQENLGGGATSYGLILAIGALGAVVGGVLVAPVLTRIPGATLAQWLGLTGPPLFVAMALASGPATVAAAMFLFFLTGVMWNTVSLSYRQRAVPDEIRGRVNSVYRMFAWGMMPLGLVASGALVRWAETVIARDTALILPFLVAAAGIMILAIFSWRPLGVGLRI